jgi:transcriptional regulator
MTTIRRTLAQLLFEGEFSARDLSRLLSIREREVYEHLPHVAKSIGNLSTIISTPARCLDCGFVFKKRERLTTPGKCPVCRSEAVSPPLYGINKVSKQGDEKKDE